MKQAQMIRVLALAAISAVGLSASAALFIAGEHWQGQPRTMMPTTAILALGLLATGVVAILVGALQRRHSLVEALVQERTRALEATTARLSERERHYRALITKPGVPLLVVDPATGDIVEANPAACAFYGYDLEQMQRLRITDINTLPRDEVAPAMAQATHANSAQFWFPHKLASGKTREVEVHSSPFEVGGRPLLFCIIQDVTERRRTEETLAKESRKNQAFLRNASDGVHILDANGNVLEASDSFCEMLGYARNELIGMNVRQWEAFYSPEETSALLRQGLATTDRAIFETHNRRKDGRIIEVEVSAQALDLDGERVMFASSRDITTRRVLERELENHRTQLEELVVTRTTELAASEAKFRALVEQSLAGIYIIEDGFIRYANQAFADALGFESPADIVDRVPLMELIAPKDRALMAENIRKRLSGEVDAVRYEFTGLRKDGSLIEVEVHGRRLDDKPRAVIGIALDVTERKRAEAAREAALAATEQLSRMKSEFMANTSHELRTPLNGVIGMATVGLMAKELPKAQQALRQVLQSAQKLQDMIESVLDFSEVDSGQLRPNTSSVDIRMAIGEVVRPASAQARAKGLVFNEIYAPDLPDRCLTDGRRLSQILTNLLSNAVKFTHDGEVTITAGRDADRLVVRVVDTGVGITPEHLAHMFYPFEQGDGRTSRRYGGTGLGLALAHRVVQMMGGSIEVESAPRAGSTFEVRLPLIEVALEPRPDRAEQTSQAAYEPDPSEVVSSARRAGAEG